MAGSMQRRGPEGGSPWVDGAAGFAMTHRHLAPLAASHSAPQPLVSSCGRYVLSSDGEIDNGGELIARLRNEGRQFPGATNLEAITEGAAAWGVEAVLQRIEGEIAGALWDREQRRLYLFRYRLGAKPLYWTKGNGSFLFGSELKALRASKDFQPSLDRDSLATYLRRKSVPSPYSIYRGVRSLEGGTILTLASSGEPQINRYWSLEDVVRKSAANRFEGSDCDALDRYDELLHLAARRRLRPAAVNVFLSGGIDSALLLAIAKDLSNKPVRAFTVAFEHAAYDESRDAEAIARHLGSEQTTLRLDALQVASVLPELPDIADEPNADISLIPAYLLARLAREHGGTIFTGDGAAEAFGGGSMFKDTAILYRRLARLPMPVRRAARKVIRLLPADAWTALSLLGPKSLRQEQFGDKLHRLSTVLTGDADEFYQLIRSHWDSPDELVIGGQERPETPEIRAAESLIPDFFDRMHFFHALSTMPDAILAKSDRAAAAAGVPLRFPFLDPSLAQFGWSLPQHLKLRDGRIKWIMNQAAYRYVPGALLDRRKMGFDAPMGDWLRGPLRDWAEDLLSEARLKREGVFKPQRIRERWQDHLLGRRNRQASLWVALVFQAWKQRWLPAG